MYAGGVVEPKCPYKCTSEKYRMPNCYTMLEDLVYTLGGPWLFTLLLSCIMVILALVLSVARMKLVSDDDFTGPPPPPSAHQGGAHIDHSFPFLESLEEVKKDQINSCNKLFTLLFQKLDFQEDYCFSCEKASHECACF